MAVRHHSPTERRAIGELRIERHVQAPAPVPLQIHRHVGVADFFQLRRHALGQTIREQARNFPHANFDAGQIKGEG